MTVFLNGRNVTAPSMGWVGSYRSPGRARIFPASGNFRGMPTLGQAVPSRGEKCAEPLPVCRRGLDEVGIPVRTGVCLPVGNEKTGQAREEIRAGSDPEETRTPGALNRLIAEKANPQADVYWAKAPFRAEVLRQQNIGAPYTSPKAASIAASSSWIRYR